MTHVTSQTHVLSNRLALDPIGGWLGLVAAAAALVALAAWAYFTTRAPLGRGRRTMLWLTRGFIFLLMLFGLSRPVALVVDPSRDRPEIVMLLDRSASMLLPADADSGTTTRAARAAEVARVLTPALGERFHVTVREFDRALGSPTGYSGSVTPDSSGVSAPGDAVEAVLREGGERSLAGIVLVSDGAATSGRDIVSVANHLSAPLYAVAVGDSTFPSDLQVIGVEPPPAAFVGETARVLVRARSTGKAATAVLVLSDAAGRELSRASVQLGGLGAVVEQVFRIKPEKPGTSFYRIDLVADASSNRLRVNDTCHFALDVRQERLGVLVLEENLSWDFTFLKRTLERDTTLAYTFLVRPGGARMHAIGAGSSKEFPRTLDELRSFEAVVLGDVSRDFLTPGQYENLATYVEGGGGLLLLGGNGAAGLGRFEGTALERVSPVRLTRPPASGPGSGSAEPLTAIVTDLGSSNPLVSIQPDLGRNRALWADLPPVRPAVGAGATRPGAQVLVELGANPPRFPLVTIGRAGAGRVMVFAGQNLWKWDFLREGLGKRDGFFERFWVGNLRWLADPEPSERVFVQPQRRVFRAGDDVVLGGRVLGPDLKPLQGGNVALVLSSAAGRQTLSPEWGQGGAVTFRGGTLPPGTYDYQLTVDARGIPPSKIEGRFLVERNGPEWWQLAARPDVLRQATTRSHGLTVRDDHAAELAARIPAPTLASVRPTEVALWAHPAALALLLVALCAEWWSRRRVGLA